MSEQLILIAFITWSIYLLVAVSFYLIYQSADVFHFDHAAIFTSGAYFSFLFSQILGWSFYTSIPVAIILALLLGSAMEFSIYKPLRKRGSSVIVLLLASLGIYIVLQNLISLFFGDDTKSIRTC